MCVCVYLPISLKVLMVACGNSLEINVSSNVAIFVGQDQIKLVSAIIKSTMIPTSPPSDTSIDTATLVSSRLPIPYQAVLSGNRITVCLFQSSLPTQQSRSSLKMNPLIQIAIDHPLCTVTSNGSSIQYSVSCYDAHVDMAGSGKELSSEYFFVNVTMIFCHVLCCIQCILLSQVWYSSYICNKACCALNNTCVDITG